MNVPATRARLLSLAAAFSWAFPLAADAFLMGGPDCSIAVGSLAWCWNGSLLSPFRSALTDPAKFGEFVSRYRAELAQPERATALQHLRDLARNRPLTLLTATKQPDISEAAVLADLLRERPGTT